MLLAKLESGLLGFETEHGAVFVQPTGWQRVHLLWTFRNFQSLSIKLLSARQVRLVESLYQTAAMMSRVPPDQEFLIGMVEETTFPARPQLTAPSQTEKRMGIVMPYNSTAKNELVTATPAQHEEKKNRKPQRPEEVATGKHKRQVGHIGWGKMGLAFGAGTLGILVAVFALDQIHVSASSSRAASVQKVEAPAAGTPFQAAVTTPQSENPPRVSIQAASITEVVNSKQPKSSLSKATSLAEIRPSEVEVRRIASVKARGPEKIPASIVSQTRENHARVEFSRSPRRVVYPDYPATQAKGRVALKAVLTPEGTVREVKVLSGNKVLAAAALRAVRQWHYAPFYKDGQSVETETNISILFISEDAISITFPPAEPVAN
jgi:TonB family protein